MLNPVECMEEPPLMAPPSSTLRPRPGAVWVHSKGQPSYEFCPWMDPCSPDEWPYDLQALRGTEDYNDILAWYFRRYHHVSRHDVESLLSLLVGFVGAREVSVAVYHDIDTQDRHLWFIAWGFSADRREETARAMLAFDEFWISTLALRHLVCKVSISAAYGSFDDRDLSRTR